MRTIVFFCKQPHFSWHYLLVIADNTDNAWEAVGRETGWKVDDLKNVCKIVVNLERPVHGQTAMAEIRVMK